MAVWRRADMTVKRLLIGRDIERCDMLAGVFHGCRELSPSVPSSRNLRGEASSTALSERCIIASASEGRSGLDAEYRVTDAHAGGSIDGSVGVGQIEIGRLRMGAQ